MKKKLLLLATLLTSMFAQAKDYSIEIKGTEVLPPGNTVVVPDGYGEVDTLTVLPAIDAIEIYVLLKDSDGNVLQMCCIPAKSNDRIDIFSASLPNNFILEIRDDKGFVYTKNEEE